AGTSPNWERPPRGRIARTASCAAGQGPSGHSLKFSSTGAAASPAAPAAGEGAANTDGSAPVARPAAARPLPRRKVLRETGLMGGKRWWRRLHASAGAVAQASAVGLPLPCGGEDRAPEPPLPPMPSSPAPADRVAELRRRIEDANRRYHELDAPDITDAQYDALVRELEALEREHPELALVDSPTRRVGAAPSGRFAPVTHAVPMLSLGNAFSDEEVADFVRRIRQRLGREDAELAFSAEPKLDGLAISLRYEDGRFVQGATRGDGATGEDVTANLRTIGDIPHQLAGAGWPKVLEVRGEVYMARADFERWNEQARLHGGKVLANPRNGAAG